MLVRSDRRYRFEASPEELWERFGDVSAFRSWWPWLRRFDAAALAPGERWGCTVQPPLPYTLRFTITIGEVEELRRIEASVAGDIHGTATLEVAEVDDGAEIHLRSQLAPSNRYLRTVAKVAAPVVRFGHDWVLDMGARQFRTKAL